jgi:hypothetical protein
MKIHVRSCLVTAMAATLFFGVCSVAVRADAPAVMVNGRLVSFDQPPVEQAGRVFVPLRGVFEQLGATVVYDNGLINATGNGRNISLHVGSTQATVNGQTQTLDVAPFVVGARTLVPLRFVAQALGAAVAWDQNSNTVRINSGAAAISNGGRGVGYANGRPNFLSAISPMGGTRVRGSFSLTGMTRPNATVTIVASARTGGISGLFDASGVQRSQTTTTADGNGNFRVRLNAAGLYRGGTLTLRLRSTAPNGSTAVQTLTLST